MSLQYGYAKGKLTNDPNLVASRHGPETQYHLRTGLLVGPSGGGPTWDLAINVGTNNPDDLLKYRLVRGFIHPILAALGSSAPGFRDLTTARALPSLDFLRGDILGGTGSWQQGGVMDGTTGVEPTSTFLALLKTAVQRQADVYVFGRAYKTGLGIHDVHMNQGSTGSFLNNGRDDHNDHNDIWQDGAVLIDLAADGWSAYFTAFALQIAPTDDLGNPAPGGHPIGDADPGSLAGR